MGTGRSKKEAKHAAAKAVLDKMIVSTGGSEEDPQQPRPQMSTMTDT